MRDNKRVAFAALGIFLLLSASPINAGRTALVNNVVQHSNHVEINGVNFGTPQCERWESTFTRNLGELNVMTQAMDESGGSGTIRSQIGLLMKMRSTMRTFRRATRAACEWVTDANMDPAVLENMTARSLDGNECGQRIQEVLSEAAEGSAEQQTAAVLTALQMLTSGSCEASDADTGDLQRSNATQEEVAEQDLENEIEDLEDESDDMIGQLAVVEDSGASLIQTEASHIVMIALFPAFVTFLAFALFCAIGLAVTLLIIGLMLCLIVGFMGILLGNPFAGNRCMNWFAASARNSPMICFFNYMLNAWRRPWHHGHHRGGYRRGPYGRGYGPGYGRGYRRGGGVHIHVR